MFVQVRVCVQKQDTSGGKAGFGRQLPTRLRLRESQASDRAWKHPGFELRGGGRSGQAAGLLSLSPSLCSLSAARKEIKQTPGRDRKRGGASAQEVAWKTPP